MGQTQQDASLLARINALQRGLAEVRKAAGLGSATISHGDLTVTDGGSIIVVATDGTQLILNPVGAIGPEMRMLPSGDPTNYSTIYAVQATSGEAEVIITSGIGSADHATQFRAAGDGMGMGSYNPDGSNGGGAMALSPTVLEYAMIQTVGGVGNFAGAAQSGTASTNFLGVIGGGGVGDTYSFYDAGTGCMTYTGRQPNFLDAGATQGIYTGQSAAGSAGDTSYTLTYGSTKSSTMVPIAVLVDTTVHPTTVTSESTTGFVLTWTTASHANYRVNFYSYRV